MPDIVYYFVPGERMDFPANQDQFNVLDLGSWTDIIIADSETVYEKKKWYERIAIDLFVDKTKEVAQLLWELKHKDEELFITNRLRRSKKGVSEKVKNVELLVKALEEPSIRNYNYTFQYKKQGYFNKLIYITDGETIELFARNEDVEYAQSIICKWADKGDYFKYELGE